MNMIILAIRSYKIILFIFKGQVEKYKLNFTVLHIVQIFAL